MTSSFKALYRKISTENIDELSQFIASRNREYIQTKPGNLKICYRELNLGCVQIVREKVSRGALISACPPASFLPFPALISNDTEGKFHGKKMLPNMIYSASGGDWDVNYSNHIDYIGANFNKAIFLSAYTDLRGKEPPKLWSTTTATVTDERALNRYKSGLARILLLIERQPDLQQHAMVMKALGESIFNLTLNMLEPAPFVDTNMKQPNRIAGVRRAIDYLKQYANELPSMHELCTVSQLSERNLQYGFKDYTGVSPMQYRKLLRLNNVRKELLRSSRNNTQVMDIALKWGFFELGRFSRDYKLLFEELPSETLKRYVN
ncbi:helix-turn-helix domain-containing protein [Vibrio sp. YMD68]|uniref:helix-turn-helix domain-containing protein n=1 Tax=Vibrio sp. YMD68 TaxID=3042300 RepID=UPI002499CC47|nr:helix-turn-helix domain-containing protein [Vibrio sp. YMD68]WGV98301.1 helix-turn-helix domain-containing protein [Vibrio sp. YMD68]